MTGLISQADVKAIATGGYYIALRVGFAFPMEEQNALPPDWVEHYTQQRFMLQDPVMRWIYANTGVIRWSDIDLNDPMRVMQQAHAFGLRFGCAIVCMDGAKDGQRSFGSFTRPDREFEPAEIAVLRAYVMRLHHDKAPPTNLTTAEIEALRKVKAGQRLKEIAHDFGVSEGAIKQRLRNAKQKLGAKTSAQAAAVASEFGLI